MCAEGFARDDSGKCASPESTLPKQPTPQPPPKLLTVSVMPKNVTLPDNSAELIAAVVPEAPEGTKYQVLHKYFRYLLMTLKETRLT